MTTLEILQSYCRDDELRKWMNTPFLITHNKKEIFAATSAHELIAIRSSNLTKDLDIKITLPVTNASKKIVLNGWKKLSKSKTYYLDQLRAMLNPDKKEKEIIQIDNTKTCPECFGEGEVEWEYKDNYKFFDCPSCDGSGETGKVVTKQGDKMVYSDDYRVLFINSIDDLAYCNPNFLDRAIEVFEFLGIEKPKIHLENKQIIMGNKDVLIVFMGFSEREIEERELLGTLELQPQSTITT